MARTRAEVRAAQALRYRVFHNEMGAGVSSRSLWLKRDIDSFDPLCDHLIVVDRSQGHWPVRVVGTYRLLRGSVALRHNGFYTAAEFDLGPLMDQADKILELGRSCVDRKFRTGGTMQLLWRGIADYILRYDIKWMLGCASFPGTNPADFSHALSFLYHRHLLPQNIRPRALSQHFVAMGILAPEALDRTKVRTQMPPLLKGYLRLGGQVGDGAVIDHSFKTTDVCLVVPVASVTERYLRHYYRDNEPQSL